MPICAGFLQIDRKKSFVGGKKGKTNSSPFSTDTYQPCQFHQIGKEFKTDKKNCTDNADQGVANINFWYEWIFEYIYIQKTIRTNIRIYSYQKDDTNEYPNIFVSKKQYEWISEYIRIRKMIRIWYERIFISENIWMYEYIRIKFFILVLDLMLDVGFLIFFFEN